jgi:hypothetical protein
MVLVILLVSSAGVTSSGVLLKMYAGILPTQQYTGSCVLSVHFNLYAFDIVSRIVGLNFEQSGIEIAETIDWASFVNTLKLSIFWTL